jgi:hypothetical protein
MKLAPWMALAAIALLMSGSLLSRKESTQHRFQALDFTGIDTLVLENAHFDEVKLGNFPGRMVDKFDSQVSASATRQGRVLTIRIEHAWLEIEAPATLRRIVGAGQVSVAHGVRVRDMLLEGNESIKWRGDVDRLRIVHATAPSEGTCKCPGHDDFTVGTVDVEGGRIGELRVRSERGHVTLGRVEDIGHATLELGEHAEYDLGGLHGKPPEVTLIALPATPPAAPARVAKPAPPGSPAEPPRSR